MAHGTSNHSCTSINCISRSGGTGKVDQVYYSANAPKNQPFNPKDKKILPALPK